MKKIILCAVAIAAAFTFTACGSSPEAMAKEAFEYAQKCEAGDESACMKSLNIIMEAATKLNDEEQKRFEAELEKYK